MCLSNIGVFAWLGFPAPALSVQTLEGSMDGSSLWFSATHVGDVDWFLAPGFHRAQPWLILVIWGVDHWVGSIFSLSFSFHSSASITNSLTLGEWMWIQKKCTSLNWQPTGAQLCLHQPAFPHLLYTLPFPLPVMIGFWCCQLLGHLWTLQDLRLC